MPVRNILGFDSATEQLALGLQTAAGLLVRNLPGGAAASASLLPQVQALLTQAGLGYADLHAVAFGRGPGAFTGLRTACAVAQGIAFARALPVLAIDSLLIVAEDARQQLGADEIDIAVAMDARMDEVYAGCWRHRAGRWQALRAPALYTLPALDAAWQGLVVQAVAGSALAAFADRITWPTGARRLPVEQDRAAALLRLAVAADAAGEGVAADQALPLYLRDKVALTTREREAVRAAAAP
jgi:tRNA threonylcarbamoyladenosine biosynthesis protein TsaB